jgi:hypothetical protein
MTRLARDTHTSDQAIPGVRTGSDVDAAELPGPTIDPTRVRLTGLRPAEWDTEAACAGKVSREDDAWHPGPDGATGTFTPRARQTCHTCPVRLQCLALGLALLPLGDVHGMYGGFTPAELRQIARKRGMADRTVAQHGTRARYVAGCHADNGGPCGPCLRAHAAYYLEQRAEARYAETSKGTEPTRLPTAEPTDTPVPALFNLAERNPA